MLKKKIFCSCSRNVPKLPIKGTFEDIRFKLEENQLAMEKMGDFLLGLESNIWK